MKRCRATLELRGSWGTERLWPGLEVDLDRELEPGFTVGDAVAGRDDVFEDIEIENVEIVARDVGPDGFKPVGEE